MAHGLRSKDMGNISPEIKAFFEQTLNESLKPLAKKESIIELLEALEQKISRRFEERFDDQEKRFEAKFQQHEKRITELESTLVLRQKSVDLLLEEVDRKSDENEQYSRRSCLRIHGIECDDNNEEVVEDIVLDCFRKVNLNLDKSSIDRAHRIGVSYLDSESKRMTRSIIVKFRSWSERMAFYKARPTGFSGGKKKPGVLPFRVSLDLTKRRYDLLKHARTLIDNNDKFLFAFADSNCFLGVKDVGNKFHFFTNKAELENIISKV